MSGVGRAVAAYRRDGIKGLAHGIHWRIRRLMGGRGPLRGAAAGARLLAKQGPKATIERVRWGLRPGAGTGPPAPGPPPPHPWTLTHAHSAAFGALFDLDAADLAANAAITGRFGERPAEVRTATWFLTYFDHAFFGGIRTILRLMDYLAREHGVHQRVVVFDRPSATDALIRAALTESFPGLAGVDIVIPGSGGIDYDELPYTDIALATMWISAYPLARFTRTGAKFYMVQDFEPAFYPAGTLSALAEATYRMGFGGIVNSPGLGEIYASYGNPAMSFTPAVDSGPPLEVAGPKGPVAGPKGPVQVVLYGRPSTPRNAFELIASACHLIKGRYGERVRIVSAGEDWDPGELGLEGIVENRGRLDRLEEVQDLYRGSDIGVCFMLSKHPSYQPFEYLASGVAPVVNVNSATEWFLVDGENCLAVEPFPSQIAGAVARLIEDPQLRSRLVANGRRRVLDVSWEEQLAAIWDFITGSRGT